MLAHSLADILLSVFPLIVILREFPPAFSLIGLCPEALLLCAMVPLAADVGVGVVGEGVGVVGE
jgi:hypothetical protein